MHDSDSTATTVKAWSHSTPPFPSTLSCISISIPDQPLNPNDLLIEIYSASLNPVDVQLVNLPIFRLPSFKNSTRGLGKDFVGKLLAKGTNVKEYEIGDELMGVTFNPVSNTRNLQS
jgi:NADPH:quinone reductase-like Zn-dependent oxidoreductase